MNALCWIFFEGRAWPRERSIRFWWQSRSFPYLPQFFATVMHYKLDSNGVAYYYSPGGSAALVSVRYALYWVLSSLGLLKCGFNCNLWCFANRTICENSRTISSHSTSLRRRHSSSTSSIPTSPLRTSIWHLSSLKLSMNSPSYVTGRILVGSASK